MTNCNYIMNPKEKDNIINELDQQINNLFNEINDTKRKIYDMEQQKKFLKYNYGMKKHPFLI